MMKKKDNNLLKPEQAVESYLDSLLQEISPDQPGLKPLPVKDNIVLLADFDIPEEESNQPVEVEIEPSDTVISPPEEVSSRNEVTTQEQLKERQYDYSYPIQCLMFRVASTQLSIPLIDLGGVLPWVKNMTQLPSSQSWSLGVFQHRDRNIRVVDSAGLLNIRKLNSSDSKPGHILVFGDGDWALSCDSLGEVVKVESSEIQWSGPKSSGLSMGTLKGSLAQLLDPMKIMQYLERITVAS
jgi:purine-binding chemotaxis protein CheW